MFEQEINLSDHYGMIVPPNVVNDTYPSIHTRNKLPLLCSDLLQWEEASVEEIRLC